MKKYFLLIMWFVNSHFLSAQVPFIDSLKTILRSAKGDTAQLKAMNVVGKELYKKGYYDSAAYCATTILSLTDKMFGRAKNKGEVTAIKNEEIRAYQLKANIYLDHNQFDDCLKTDSIAIRLCQENDNKLYLAGCFITIGTVFSDLGNYQEARKNDSLVLKYATKALAELKESNNYEWIRIAKRYNAVAINNIGNTYKFQSQYQEALDKFWIAQRAFEEINDKPTLAICLFNIGIILRHLGNYGDALKNEMKAVQIQEEIGDNYNLSFTYSEIGIIYLHNDNFAEALKYLFKSLKICEVIGNKSNISFTYIRIGDVYSKQRNYTEAFNNYKQAKEIAVGIGNKNIIVRSDIDLGNTYRIRNEYDKAHELYDEALGIAENLGDKSSISDVTNNIGAAYDEQNNYSEALKYYKRTLKIKLELNEKLGIAAVYVNIGNALLHLKKYKEAESYYQKALQLGKEMDEREIILQDYRSLAALNEKQGDYKKALQYFENYSDAKDSSFNEDINKQIAQMKTQYETEKKDNEIKLLNKDKQIQAAELVTGKNQRKYMLGGFSLLVLFSGISFLFYNQNRKTSFNRQVAEVEMKALRSQMNPHFIFNSLNSIHTFLIQNDSANASEYLLKFSRLMRLILENSREQEVPLSKDLEALELYMQLEAVRMNHRFSYKIQVDPQIESDSVMVAPLLLQPFAENSIWHGFQGKEGPGLITVSISKTDNMIRCVLEDDGVGRPQSIKDGGNGDKSKNESLGMKITDARISIINKLKKVNASIKLTDLAQGLRVELLLPFEPAY